VESAANQQMAIAFAKLYDRVPPTVTINRADAQASPTNVRTVNYTVVFSKAPAAFVAANVTFAVTGNVVVTPGNVTVTPLAAPAGSPPVAVAYNVQITGVTGNGNLTATIANAAVQAVGGTAFPASTSTATNNVIVLQP
jgi:hypothetical protein